jgi:predicted transglutaminase-like cysteine proteinase
MGQSSVSDYECAGQTRKRFYVRLFQTFLIGTGLVFASVTAQAQTFASLSSGAQPIQNGGTAKPILGWVKFCEQNPGECAVNTGEARVITLTPQIWNAIVSVNKRVNADIKPVTDQEHLGVVDNWSLPSDGKGDCEDYQLLKRKILADMGLPRRAMRMTVVIDEIGEGHAVLMIRTDKGDYILDNKTSAVLSWDATGYSYVKRESQEATAWVSLGGITTSPTTTANR